MRPYLAIIVDSFREALYSRVLWILLGLITLLLIALMPLGVSFPVTTALNGRDIRELSGFGERLLSGSSDDEFPTRKVVWSRLSPELQARLKEWNAATERSGPERFALQRDLVSELNSLIEDVELFSPSDLQQLRLGREGADLLDRREKLTITEQQRLNRLSSRGKLST